ncbi:MAG: corrinoid protein [Desulfobacterales bacterium]|jgi:corrinoid protein of di/trimethylamine methyltransferase
MLIYREIVDAVIKGDPNQVTESVQKALDESIAPDDIISEGLIAAMDIVGKNYAEAKIFIPEMLIAANAMKKALALLNPLLVDGKMKTIAEIVIGTVKGDLHDIGKNLVGMMMEGAGLGVIDIGINAPPQKFVEMVKTHRPRFVGISALLTTTMPSMQDVIAALEEAGVRQDVKVIVGGAPVTQSFADEIGADAYGSNASEAVFRIKEFLSQP